MKTRSLKLIFFCKKSKIITISDDSGLEVDCLQGEPGIFSARWAKDYGSFYNASLEILKELKNLIRIIKQKTIMQILFAPLQFSGRTEKNIQILGK